MKILLFILLLFCIKQVSSQSCFNPTKLFTTNSNPYSFCSADINGDGKIDLAIANYGANNITLRLGRGDGTFQNATNYAVGTNPYEIISGDFNNDGKKDIAVTNFGSGTISVLLNNGAGGLNTAINGGSAPSPRTFITSDYNLDGKLDIALVNNSSEIRVMFGDGLGHFVFSANYMVAGSVVNHICDGDFNGDGKIDIAVTNNNTNTVSLLKNNGNGTFASNVDYNVDLGPRTIISGDFSDDGKLDLAISNYNSNTISILKNNGAGGFDNAVNYNVGLYSSLLTKSDLDQDGKTDLIIGAGGNVRICKGTSLGTLTFEKEFRMGYTNVDIMSEDFNGDNIPDIASLSSYSLDISIVLGTGSLGYNAKTNLTLSQTSGILLPADFNNDGIKDFVGSITTLIGKGGGTFNSTEAYVSGATGFYGGAIADFNGDGYSDLAVTHGSLNAVKVYLNNGNGGFATATNFTVGSNPRGVASGDFNADSKIDLAVINTSSSTISILLGTGAGSFNTAINIPSGGGGGGILVTGDVNEDGKLDLCTGYNILFGDNLGGFTMPTTSNVGSYPFILEDLNGDSHLDMAFAMISTANVFLGDGTGSFPTSNSYTMGNYITGITTIDINNDGIKDLASSNRDSKNVSIRIGNGAGGFGTITNYYVSDNPLGICTADVDNDGRMDLMTSNSRLVNSSYISTTCILFNPSSFVRSQHITLCEGQSITVGGNTHSTSGTYTDILTSLAGCDSTITTHLTIVPKLYTQTHTICQGDSIKIGLSKYDSSGIYVDSLYTSRGCDSIITTNLTVLPSPVVNQSATICAGSSLQVGTHNYTLSGKYVDVFTTSQGCDSTVITELNVLYGNGTSNFIGVDSFTIGNTIISMRKADFNGDGNVDLAGMSASNVSICLGDGTGNFIPFSTLTNGSTSNNFILPADLNADGKQDLILVSSGNSDKISIFIGNGNGTFTSVTSYNIAIDPFSVCTGDFNGDEKMDIAYLYMYYSGFYYDQIGILLGTGTGTFTYGDHFSLGSSSPQCLVSADFNKDGKTDLVTGNVNNSYGATISLGKGDGTFYTPTYIEQFNNCEDMVMDDFNEDDNMDLAYVKTNTLRVMLGNGSGGFVTTGYNIGPYIQGKLIYNDFNGDGKLDFGILQNYPQRVSILTGNETGSFILDGAFNTINPYSGNLLSDDFNNDGKPDWLTSHGAGLGTITIYLNAAENRINQTLTICHGQSCIVGSSSYNTPGIYTDTLINSTGCDSVITTTLSVLEMSLGNDTVQCGGNIILNALTAGSTYLWNEGSTTPSITVNQTGTYYVDVTTPYGCIISDTISVTINECVWPGDTDYDLNVTQNDLLPIGVHFNESGIQRPSASNTWLAQDCLDWSQNQISGINKKHIDCDGDSVINYNDTLALHMNFGFTHTARMATPKYVATTNPDLLIVFDKPFYLPGDTVNSFIHIGTSQNPQTNFYGAGFELNYDISIIVPGSEKFNFNNSWVGNVNQSKICFSKISSGIVYNSLVKTTHQDTSGNGKIANFSFILKDSISSNQLYLVISNAIKTDHIGNITPLTSGTDSAEIIHNSVGINQPYSYSLFKIYPNPSENELTIDSQFDLSSSITLNAYNVLGQNCFDVPLTSKKQNIDISSLASGMYFIVIRSKIGEIANVKLIKK